MQWIIDGKKMAQSSTKLHWQGQGYILVQVGIRCAFNAGRMGDFFVDANFAFGFDCCADIEGWLGTRSVLVCGTIYWQGQGFNWKEFQPFLWHRMCVCNELYQENELVCTNVMALFEWFYQMTCTLLITNPHTKRVLEGWNDRVYAVSNLWLFSWPSWNCPAGLHLQIL